MVYLIHFERKLHHAQHYIGFCETMEGLERRIAQHKKGDGAKILVELNKQGIDYNVVRVWPEADRNFERKLKNQKNAKRFCPLCNPEQFI